MGNNFPSFSLPTSISPKPNKTGKGGIETRLPRIRPLASPYIGVVGDGSLRPRAKIGGQQGHQLPPPGIGKAMLRVVGSLAMAKKINIFLRPDVLAGEVGSKKN